MVLEANASRRERSIAAMEDTVLHEIGEVVAVREATTEDEIRVRVFELGFRSPRPLVAVVERRGAPPRVFETGVKAQPIRRIALDPAESGLVVDIKTTEGDDFSLRIDFAADALTSYRHTFDAPNEPPAKIATKRALHGEHATTRLADVLDVIALDNASARSTVQAVFYRLGGEGRGLIVRHGEGYSPDYAWDLGELGNQELALTAQIPPFGGTTATERLGAIVVKGEGTRSFDLTISRDESNRVRPAATLRE